jgi:predicted metal-dependent phosphoesterase TrpH
MNQMLKSAIHIHSTYSDGEFTLAELRAVYLAAGYDFVCMTDHAEFFDEAKILAYVQECEVLSDEKFRFIPGLEFECDRRMHILGIGVTALTRTFDPQEVIQHIKNENGISVIAHPMDTMFDWIESFKVLPDGIETWNSKYDGRFAPRPGTFKLLNRLQVSKSEMLAFYGQDLHWKNQYKGLFNQVNCNILDTDYLLNAMKIGDFTGIKDELELPSKGHLPSALLDSFGATNIRYHKKRQLIKKIKKTIDSFGISIPTPIKTQLRRIF